jgi:hypothetical protein
LNDVGYQGDQLVDTYGDKAWMPYKYLELPGGKKSTEKWHSKKSGNLNPRKIKGLKYIVKYRYK